MASNASPSAMPSATTSGSEPSDARIGPRFVDDFNGDNERLLDSMDALLRLHAEGALTHPIPGLARQLLNNAGARLEALRAAPASPAHASDEVPGKPSNLLSGERD